MATERPPTLEEKADQAVDRRRSVAGTADAKVTIVEFSDFQCPYCAKAVGEVSQLMQKFPKDVRLVFKQYPLDTHSQAQVAAEAALAAQAQGKFWELHDKMYANFRTISKDHILLWAKELGLDVNRLHGDIEGHKFAARVQAESTEGDNVGVRGRRPFSSTVDV